LAAEFLRTFYSEYVKMRQFRSRGNPDGLLKQRTRGLGMVHLFISVDKIGDGPGGTRVVGQFRLEFLRGLLVLALAPQPVSKTEVHIGLLRDRLDDEAKLLRGTEVLFHLVQRCAGQQISLSRLGIQGQYLAIDNQHTLILFGTKATVRQNNAEGQILRAEGRGLLQIWNSFHELSLPIVAHPDQKSQALRVGSRGSAPFGGRQDAWVR
jgi:hypothetical protein